jgi:anti-sigma factor RsiW
MRGCRNVRLLLERYVDGRLEPPRAAGVSAHVASCSRCAKRLAAARRLAEALGSPTTVVAPTGFRSRVMNEVHRLAMTGYPTRAAADHREMQRGRFYRRLGLCFMLSAAVLSVSLIIPRASYPTIFASRTVAADLSTGGAPIVRMTMAGAARVVRGTLMKPEGLTDGYDRGD